jgi:hypothetical protein
MASTRAGIPVVGQMKRRAVAAQNTANSISRTTTVRSLGHRPRDAIRGREPVTVTEEDYRPETRQLWRAVAWRRRHSCGN